MIYYKVVQRLGNKLVSVNVNPVNKEFYRIYKDGDQILKVKSGMVFENIYQARRFLIEETVNKNLEIWTCKGRLIKNPRYFVDIWKIFEMNEWDKIVKCLYSKFSANRAYSLHTPSLFPSGAKRLRDLKLIEEVQ